MIISLLTRPPSPYKHLNKLPVEQFDLGLFERSLRHKSNFFRVFDRVKMALKFGFILLLAAFIGILEVQAASVAIEKDIWNSLRQGDFSVRVGFTVVEITFFTL